ncbi:MAG: cytochrome c maturation protein CcmE [Algoriphagus sp.]|uniref:cytochrome c maturation protein CcmE domain-containing protein n=1 Tax=Algoriphagus sp. TaxID=1872435 RepID=UPI00179EB6D9|nr:cytochrome c maturation protein CcmE [Algoriphagus sp.]NVJ86546.1 cytochrome c maturation protein CcmE [Algoriphagus sp.]
MKKGHLVGIGIIAIAIIIIMTSIGDASSYETFETALVMKQSGNDKAIHVVGQLKKNESGEVIGLNVREDKTSFTFLLVDNEGTEQEVFYNEPVPADFIRSESVVVIGSYKNEDIFIADKILMKCPSKYQETEVQAAGM